MSERAIIYLDTNAWSDLSERKTAKAEEANARALDAHAKGRAIFPLSHSTIAEFLKRDVNDDSREQAYLMDQLSDSVTLRNGQHIRDLALGTYALIMDDEERPPAQNTCSPPRSATVAMCGLSFQTHGMLVMLMHS